MAGAQCKNTDSLTLATVIAAVEEAKTFKGGLGEFLVLTTADRHAALQADVRDYFKSNPAPFHVEVIFWQDIVDDIAQDETLVNKHWKSFWVGTENSSRRLPAPVQLDPDASNDDPRMSPTIKIGRIDVRRGRVGYERHSTVKITAGEPRFMGRDAEISAIRCGLEAERVVVLHGAPGLGKTRLASEYAGQYADAYPGGVVMIPFNQSPPLELAKLLRDTDRPAYSDESWDDQCRRGLRTLGNTSRTLLIYDAIADERTLRDWLPSVGQDVHLIVTSNSANWARSWKTVEVLPLTPAVGRELVSSILGDKATGSLIRRIVARGAGVTIEVCASAAATYELLRRGRAVENVEADLAKATTSSFESAWTLLSPEGQLVLQVACTFVTPRVPASLVASIFRSVAWDPSDVDKAVDEVRDRKLLGGDQDVIDIHQLVAQFVRGRLPVGRSVQQTLFNGLLAAARAFSADPGDLDRRARLWAHSLNVDDWRAVVTDSSDWHIIGVAIERSGRFEEARRWFECAVTGAEKINVEGRVQVAHLGPSLHRAGCCFLSLGQPAEALSWFKRAVAANETCDVHGGLDYTSLRASLIQVGNCYSLMGKFAEALPWFKRAIAVSKKGNVCGHAVSASLQRVGDCYARLGKFANALHWYKRAVSAAEKGDARGRVEVASVGRCLHLVVYGYLSMGEVREALHWLKRAVSAMERGNMHGRVDAVRLGRNFHLVGCCHYRLGEFVHARHWFKRAVAVRDKGDAHGRVDGTSLGTSLHWVGDCCARLGDFVGALHWFELAVSAAKKGDVYGRVDVTSLRASLREVLEYDTRLERFPEGKSPFARAAVRKKGDVSGGLAPTSIGMSRHTTRTVLKRIEHLLLDAGVRASCRPAGCS